MISILPHPGFSLPSVGLIPKARLFASGGTASQDPAGGADQPRQDRWLSLSRKALQISGVDAIRCIDGVGMINSHFF